LIRYHQLPGDCAARNSNHITAGTLACALGNKACRDGFSVLYKRASRLFADLAQARGEGRLARLMTTLERTNLLIIDDWGPEPLAAEQRRDLLEIVDDRYDKGSLLITSQVPVPQWHDIVADPTLGDAILDRIIHNAHRIELKGDSLRRLRAKRSRHQAPRRRSRRNQGCRRARARQGQALTGGR
jgi:DNA replication protein DnaC